MYPKGRNALVALPALTLLVLQFAGLPIYMVVLMPIVVFIFLYRRLESSLREDRKHETKKRSLLARIHRDE